LKISVIIVNYNVEFFLEQCLNSCIKALQKTAGEIIVVDNNSIDNSVQMMHEKFPHIQLFANKENLGFSRANNLGIQSAKGEYILLLNPDTVVEENTFKIAVDFMDKHPEAGGLGVRMLDGKGFFLPESKRGLPTPSVAFYKIIGLSKLFPKSRKFGRYHLGYLNEFETHEIEILSGAFMFIRKTALDKVGLLDEQFFMYGEDIDLSYRILLGGYKNYYLPSTRIIHYKGESTKKSSVNYVYVFYRAMIIFAEKHFSQKNAKLFSFLINFAIYCRAGMAILYRFLKKSFLPMLDIGAVLTMLSLMASLWAFNGITFPERVVHISLPIYTMVWFLFVLYAGAYDKPKRLIKIFNGIGIGTGIILIAYALLPKTWQFSRLFILIGAIAVLLYYLLSRIAFHIVLKGDFLINGAKNKSFAIVGLENEVRRVGKVLENTRQKIEKIEFVSSDNIKFKGAVGIISQLDQIVHLHQIDEVIFCAKNTTAQTIINWMSKINTANLDFKIAQPDSMYIIGSNSTHSNGEMYMFDINSITKPNNVRNKRSIDVLLSTTMIATYPLLCWFFSNKKQIFKNTIQVFLNKKSYVGYANTLHNKQHILPKIKPGILFPKDLNNIDTENDEYIQKINLIYAKNYTVWQDLKIIQKAWKKLDRSGVK
jgi:GT2 family glycosyltransferase